MLEYRLFVDNNLFFRILKKLWSLFIELDYTRFDLYYHCNFSHLSDSLFIDSFSDIIKVLTQSECDSAGDMLAFMLENEIFLGDKSLEIIIRRLSKQLGQLNKKVSVKIGGYFFNSDYEPFTYDLLTSKAFSEIEFQFKSYNIIHLFQMDNSKKINSLLDLIDLNGIKILLNQECTTSLRGLLIGLENGLVISQDENNKTNLEKFLSLLN